MTGRVVPFGRGPAGDRGGGGGPDAARSRHPTARSWVPDRARLLRRLADRAQARGARWPRVAAAVVLLRGVAGDDRAAFARRLDLAEADLARLEQGLEPASAVPDRLRAVTGLVDWSWVDGAPPAEPRSPSCPADQGFW
ncbi:MAG TPA: hypothetical protein VF015_13890 [Acidimicrobiales bacterium]